jgi:hypothetical protein
MRGNYWLAYSRQDCAELCSMEWMSEWMSEWVSEWVNEWVSEWVSEWMSEWMSEWGWQFEYNFRKNLFHLPQCRIHLCCSFSGVMTLHFAQMQCCFFTRWPNLDVTSCLDLCTVSVVIVNWVLIVRISMKDNRQSNVSETKWGFDFTINLSPHTTFLPTTVTLFQFPSIQFCSY